MRITVVSLYFGLAIGLVSSTGSWPHLILFTLIARLLVKSLLTISQDDKHWILIAFACGLLAGVIFAAVLT